MAAVVKIKNNRFVKIDLQNKDARYFSYGEINKAGVLDGYLKCIVETAYPIFQTNYYGKIRKMILLQAKIDEDEDDDEDDEDEFPIFTRGIVAEKCAVIKKGDFLLIEKPFFELVHPHKDKFHIIGDKKYSDICIWIINKKSSLIVGQEEQNGYEESESDAYAGHVESDTNAMDTTNSDDEVANTSNQGTSSDVNRNREARVKSDAPKSRKSPRNTKTDSSSSSESNNVKPIRFTRSCSSEKSSPSCPKRFTRSTLRGNDQSAKESSSSLSCQTDRHLTRSAVSKATNGDVRAKVLSQESSSLFSSHTHRRLTRSVVSKSTESDVRAKESSQESSSSFSSQTDRCLTNSSVSKATESDFRAEESSQESSSSFSSQTDRRLTRSAVSKATESDVRAKESSQESSSSFSSQTDRCLTRSAVSKAIESDVRAKESSWQRSSPFLSQTDRCLTRSAVSKATESDKASSPPTKRKRKYCLGPKGIPSSPDSSSELRNVVLLGAEPKETLRKENAQNTTLSEKSNDRIVGSSNKGSPRLQQRKVPSSSRSPEAKESSWENSSSFSSQTDRCLTRSAVSKATESDFRAEESSQESSSSFSSQTNRRLTRSAVTKAIESDVRAKESSQESSSYPSSQSIRCLTRSAVSKATESDKASSPPTKRKRKFRLGPKGIPSSPDSSSELRNVVLLGAEPKETLRKENAQNTTLSEKSNDRIVGSSNKGSPRLQQRKVPSSSRSPKATISSATDYETSQENEDNEIGEGPTTPSGTFSSKKQKLFDQSDNNSGIPKKKLQSKSKIAANSTPIRTKNAKQTDVVAGSASKVNKDAKNSNQPSNAECAVITFVDDDKVLEKSKSSSGKQTEVAKHAATKSQALPKATNAEVIQPSASEPSTSATSSNIPTTSATSSNAQTTSTTSSNGPTTSTTSNGPTTSTTSNGPTTSTTSNGPTTSTTSNGPTTSTTSNGPTTSTTSNGPTTSTTLNMPQSPSYSLPATYTKISDVQLNKVCNLYGVVKFFKPPWKSRGTDMCSVVVLADPSSHEPLECVMFKDVALLPQIRRVGDIVRLHRMNIKKYKDKLQAVSSKGFSALVFDSNVNVPVMKEAARVTTGTFSFDEAEKKVVHTLKQWRISKPDIFEEAKFLTVSKIEPDMYFDMVCQVRGISKHTNIDCVALSVTDGTEPRYEIKSSEDDVSYQAVLAADRHGQSPIFDVFLYGEHASLVMNLNVNVGTVLLLHNVHSIATQGGPGASILDVLEPSLELCIHRGSEYGRGLAVLSPDAEDAQKLLHKLKKQAPISPRKLHNQGK